MPSLFRCLMAGLAFGALVGFLLRAAIFGVDTDALSAMPFFGLIGMLVAVVIRRVVYRP